MKVATAIDFLCLDCGVDTSEIDEYYMVHDHVWAAANPDRRGMLCISCLEKRLSRTLDASDFTDFPVNRGLFPRSPLLLDRLGRAEQ